ncbi:hypothetical protein O0L34_g14716 [Tuta absoluta]|nr:hypothetical protein O0L34_g14716 [Tuta absoluta]
MGKILEKLLIKRIRWCLQRKANPRQYGFVPQRSTEDALYDLLQHIKDNLKKKLINLVVSLDIEGAFDSAWWPAIKCRLAEKRCPINLRRLVGSYLEDRKVRVKYADTEYVKQSTIGCVQGSIGGPAFWNLLLDPLLDGLDERDTYCQAFADDVVLVFSGKTASVIEQKANTILEYIRNWGVENKLKFAPHKTNAMIITKKLKFDLPKIQMGETDIQLVEEIKLLGLTIDHRLTFQPHVSKVCRKATNLYKQLSRAAKITWGLNPEIIRTMYVAVVEPVIMYAASVWAQAAQKIYIQKQLNTVQRGFAQKICKAYRTVSLNAALILTGLLPLDLRIQEAAQLFEAKRGRPQDILAGRELEQRVCFLEAQHPAIEQDIQFECLEDFTPETIDKHQIYGTKIFTDGSKIEGKVGAAFSCWNDSCETNFKKFKLEPYCTVFQAEMYALYRATIFVLEKEEQSTAVLSDSRSSLELLKDRDSFHPLAYAIRRNLTSIATSGKTIRLFWVRAHIGVQGNERADELAKEAALHSKTASDYDRCPISFIKRHNRLKTIEDWNNRYKTENKAAVTKMFMPDASRAYRLVRKLKLNPALVQVLTGHGGFSAYLNRFKCKDSPSCICDPEKEETVEHLLTECPKYDSRRLDLEIEINYKIAPKSLGEIIECKQIRKPFLEYCENIAKEVIKRNKN